MRIIILNRDYPAFLTQMYSMRPGLHLQSYDSQVSERNSTLFGVADYYSANFRAEGHDAREVHVNNPWLQAAWAREHGLRVTWPLDPGHIPNTSGGVARARSRLGPIVRPLVRKFVSRQITNWEQAIVRAQIEHFRPDVILNQEMSYIRSRYLESVKGPSTVIVGQIASALPGGEDFRAYDLIVSSLPNFVAWFQAKGLPAALNRLAFEPRVLKLLEEDCERDVEVSFVGSLSSDHRSRIGLLETLAGLIDLRVWGSGIESLSRKSPLHRCYQGEAWGRDMYAVLQRSRITLNHHIDLAEGFANNMRLYEATGMGALMLVDATKGLEAIFHIGEEVVSYADAEDCARRVRSLLKNEAERDRIAAAGQERTLREHTYRNRVRDLIALFEACSVEPTRKFCL